MSSVFDMCSIYVCVCLSVVKVEHMPTEICTGTGGGREWEHRGGEHAGAALLCKRPAHQRAPDPVLGARLFSPAPNGVARVKKWVVLLYFISSSDELHACMVPE